MHFSSGAAGEHEGFEFTPVVKRHTERSDAIPVDAQAESARSAADLRVAKDHVDVLLANLSSDPCDVVSHELHRRRQMHLADVLEAEEVHEPGVDVRITKGAVGFVGHGLREVVLDLSALEEVVMEFLVGRLAFRSQQGDMVDIRTVRLDQTTPNGTHDFVHVFSVNEQIPEIREC